MLIRMAKSVKSNLWFFRVDGNREFLTEKFRELSQNLDTMELLSVFHVGEKGEHPHAHCVVALNTSTQKQSFAIRLKKLFDIEKRHQYALDVWDGDKVKGATSYLFHEKDAPVLCNKGFTEEQLNEARMISDEVQKVVQRNKEKASGRLVERAIEQNLSGRYDILCYMLNEIKEGKAYHPGNYKLKQYVEEVEIRQTKDIGEYATSLMSELWR